MSGSTYHAPIRVDVTENIWAEITQSQGGVSTITLKDSVSNTRVRPPKDLVMVDLTADKPYAFGTENGFRFLIHHMHSYEMRQGGLYGKPVLKFDRTWDVKKVESSMVGIEGSMLGKRRRGEEVTLMASTSGSVESSIDRPSRRRTRPSEGKEPEIVDLTADSDEDKQTSLRVEEHPCSRRQSLTSLSQKLHKAADVLDELLKEPQMPENIALLKDLVPHNLDREVDDLVRGLEVQLALS